VEQEDEHADQPEDHGGSGDRQAKEPPPTGAETSVWAQGSIESFGSLLHRGAVYGLAETATR
jgi:hypothetical protein